MRSSLARFAIVAGFLVVPSLAQAETLIQNDSVGEMFDGTTATAEIIEGEMYEAVFDIPAEWLGPNGIEILGVRVVMVKDPNKANGCGRFGIDIWEEGMNAAQSTTCTDPMFNSVSVDYKDPGMQVFTQDSVVDPQTGTVLGFEVRGDATRGQATFKDLRFSTINQNPNVTINPVMVDTTRVRVAIRALDLQCTAGGMIGQGDHFPILLSDDDGVSAQLQNFIYGEPLVAGFSLCPNVMGSQHYAWEDMGPFFNNAQPGDWVMRLIVNHDDPNMGGDDMGMGEDLGMTNIDAGVDMSMPPEDTGTDMSMPVEDMASNNANNGANNATNNENNGNNQTTGDGLMLDSVTPSDGPNDQSVDVVIVGSGFQPGAEVLLDAEAIGVTETRAGRIRATVPEGLEPGEYDVVVTNPDGETGVLMNGYTVTEAMMMTDNGGGSKGASGGCCSEVRGARTTSGLGLGITAFLLAIVVGARRRRNGVR